ncbi:MAG: glycogen synthase GlgA [Deltaproteobacteria bacterium]|nr:glycogen synthase GlgA [Deltaproteobacteria bacterium]
MDPTSPKVLFISSEASPFAKTGGLADVGGALPTALADLGAQVMQVLPLYGTVREKGFKLTAVPGGLKVRLGRHTLRAGVFETHTDAGNTVYFIDYRDFFDRPYLYGQGSRDYGDNLERFAFFCHAALTLPQKLSFSPTVVHSHDWQTGLVPALLKGPYHKSTPLTRAASVFTIHNIGYPGLFAQDRMEATGLSREEFFHTGGLEYYGWISLLKSGIVYADAVTTVSPTYAQEIQRPEYGMGMDGILRHRASHVYGILNGADYHHWDPETDPHIPHRYGPERMAGKPGCKKALIQEMGLDATLREKPLLAVISRLDHQKGLDLLVPILDAMVATGAGLVILGEGDGHMEWQFKEAARRHKGRVAAFIGFNEGLAHRILAGADILLIPSRYEPCGLTQLYALKYGTVPVVRGTGGLEDTVEAFDYITQQGTGFKFYPYDPWALFGAVREGVAAYHHSGTWSRLLSNGMQADFSWERSARQYLGVYQSITDSRQ